MMMFFSALGQALSAGLLVPFMNSLQKIESAGVSSNKIIAFISQFFEGIELEYRFIYILFFILIFLAAAQSFIIFTNRMIIKFSTFRVQYKVRSILFEKIINARIKFFYKQKSGILINHITMDIKRSYACIDYLLRIFCQILFVFAYLGIGFLILPSYTLGLLATMGIFIFVFYKFVPYIYRLGIQYRDAEEDANNIIIETIQGIRNVILSCAQKTLQLKFSNINQKYYFAIFKQSWIATSVPGFVNFVALILIAFVLFVNKNKILQSDPEYFSIILFFIYIAGNIFRLLGKLKQLHTNFAFNFQGIPALLRLDSDLNNFEEKIFKDKQKLNKFYTNIEVKSLCFKYEESTILDNLNIQILKNQKVAFVGGSGSGKSTLIDILSGFHDDYTGSILVDGMELREISKHDWRCLLGYVSQETFIFNDTVKNNLYFGFEGKISEEEIISACKNAQIYETIMSFPQQFETELGERGIRLSGGEKQRLSIARLFLKNPSIVFLDEATSSLDSESEKKVKDALDRLIEGRTVVAVAHRLSTIADFDQIYVLEKGKIVEFGTHSELIIQKEFYYKYYNIQSMGDNEVQPHP